jgi:trehalose 6-phosphate phosphatase
MPYLPTSPVSSAALFKDYIHADIHQRRSFERRSRTIEEKTPGETMTHLLATPIDLHKVAILLDVDGTLLDIAATPREVFVPESLRETLQRLLDRTGGALALVSGRPLADLDLIFAPLKLPAVGGHGAEIRRSPTSNVDRGHAAPLAEDVKRRFAEIAALGPGILIEDKGFGIALHYRLAPEKEDVIRAAVAMICDEETHLGLEVLPGKAVLEIKGRGFTKGTALQQLMQYPPFKGRRPVFIGDDRTDEHAFAVLPEFDGVGLSVGRPAPGAAEYFDTPNDVRLWLEQISRVEETASS